MSIYIYTGLSLSFKEAEEILNATYLPPIKRGDIDTLLNHENEVEIIGIIDGVFHQSPAVAHKEILKALKQGITVVGGASMGALRACELYPYGMIGIGNIFEDYKNGTIESDDDVAVSLNPDTLEQMSESFINLRYNFKNAQKKELINSNEVKNLLEVAKNIYYPKRSFNYVIKKSSLSEEKKEKLTKYLDKNKFDVKQLDAIKVIEYIKDISNDTNDN